MNEYKYCAMCGNKLELIRGPFDHYDEKDGSPVHKAWLACPEKHLFGGWLLTFLNFHDAWEGTLKNGTDFIFDPKYFGY